MTTHEHNQVSDAAHATSELVEQMSTQVSALVRHEMALAVAEMRSKGLRLGTGVGIGSAGAVSALLGLATLVASAVLGLAATLSAWLSALVVGVTLLVIAGGLAMAGIGQVRSVGAPLPEQAVRSTKRDIETVKESVHR